MTAGPAGRLARELEAGEGRRRAFAARALGAVGVADASNEPDGGTVARLVRLSLEDPDSDVRAEAVGALARLDAAPAALREGAVAQLAHPEAEVRARAAWALGKLGEDAQPALDALLATLADDPAVDGRFGAAWALARIRAQAPAAPAALARALGDPDPDVRGEVAFALGRAGGAGAPHAAALLPLLRDDDVLVCERAATALGALGTAPPEALEALRALALHARPRVRDAAAAALRTLAGGGGPDPPAPSRAGTRSSLQAAGRDGGSDPLPPVGRDGGSDPLPPVGRDGGSDPLPPERGRLLARLVEGDAFGRAEAAWLLAKAVDPGDVEVAEELLVAACCDPDSDARWSAVTALGRIGEPTRHVAGGLVGILRLDRDPDVRAAAALALGALWGQQPPDEVRAALEAARADPDRMVREDAAAVLAH